MNDYTSLAIRFVELLEKEKLSDGKILLYEAPTINELFKMYAILARDYGLGNSKSAFEKGILAVLTSFFIFKKEGVKYRFSPTQYKEFKEKFGTKGEKK